MIQRMRTFQSTVFDVLLFGYIIGSLVWLTYHYMELESPLGPSLLFWTGLGGVSLLVTILSRRTGVTFGAFLAGFKEPNQAVALSWKRRPWLWTSILCVIITFLVGWEQTQVSLTDLFSEDGFSGTKRIFFALLQPNWGIFERCFYAIIETIFIAFMATILALPPAFFMSFFGANNLMKGSATLRTLYFTCRSVMNFSRSIEPLIWAVVFSVWVGIGPFAGMLALWLTSIVSLVKLYSEQIESIDEGPIEALESVGANRVQTIAFAVVPQIVLPFISFTIYRWDINVRMATIVGLVGGGGIGTLLMQYQGLARWNEVGLIIILIAVVVWLMDSLSARLRQCVA